MGRPEGKRPLRRSSLRWDDNIKTDVQEIGWARGLIDLTQDREGLQVLVDMVMNLLDALYAGNFLAS